MHWSEPLLLCPYRPGGRGPLYFDCWGLAREALARYGWPNLPAFGRISARSRERVQLAVASMLPLVEPCAAQDGALAAVYRGGRLDHVGVVMEIDGRLFVMHTSSTRGVRRESLRAFERSQPNVRYYRARNQNIR